MNMNTITSNDPCQLFGITLDGRGGALPLMPEDDGTSTAWLHGDYSSAHAKEWLSDLGLNESTITALTRSDTRPRTLRMGSGLLVVLRGVNMNPGADQDDMVSVRFWLESRRVISLRQRRLFSIEDVRNDLDAGRGPCDVGDLFTQIVERIADRVADFVDSLEEKVDNFELAIESGPTINTRSEISTIRRQIAHVRRYLAPQREALEALRRGIPGWLDEHAHSISEESDRIARYIEDLDLARERTVLLQEEVLNRIAMEQNTRMFGLSIAAIVFLPITFVTGLFGMNVGGLPGTESANAFWIVSAVMLVMGLAVVGWLSWKRWF
jgi:zinc transporter